MHAEEKIHLTRRFDLPFYSFCVRMSYTIPIHSVPLCVIKVNSIVRLVEKKVNCDVERTFEGERLASSLLIADDFFFCA